MADRAEAFNPAPLLLDTVLSAAWLGRALGGAGDPMDVRAVHIVDQFGPSCTKVRMELEFGPSAPPGLHSAYCLKGFFGDPGIGYLKSGVQLTESAFYRDCAPTLSMRLAECVHAGSDEATGAGVLLMKDLITAGARFLTALEPYSARQAESSLDQLARLHVASWGDAALAKWPWVRSKARELTRYQVVPAARVTELMRGERGAPLPDAIRDGARIYAALGRIADRDTALPHCLIHGDAHAGNMFENADGCGIVDWQLLQRGHWSLDVAYHVAAALTVEDRRTHEQDLLRLYLDRLAAHGVTPPAWDDAWDRYRESLAYGMFLWAITIRVDPPVIMEFNRRLGTAVADHDSFGRLGV
ncbi:phosphotransferase family protein [Sphingobium baderi]|uniref:phosphotransferase family protein n=1 Tax=Sphingobium baderi TaxID=1332080 RepID=UPI002B4095E5|nr:phosphotransferase [Sphingobium baderi]WRD75580.1 phosphotransferase [Sphingobium baderi]